ncbi:uncharacterized protein LOC109936675 isoform X4 [Rhincodon typus]|uniref:uncharacterized protein LOC109936675 isoform X4 n=1 Tax=Rhincodon typus TaxID=259920 RepID=UPI00202F319C|nr:uncharacterized protein LOC109936675 isoform X4 [Rhincodon typus]
MSQRLVLGLLAVWVVRVTVIGLLVETTACVRPAGGLARSQHVKVLILYAEISPINIFKEMIAVGRQVINKEENIIKAKYQLLESEREILRLKENLLDKAEQYVDENRNV